MQHSMAVMTMRYPVFDASLKYKRYIISIRHSVTSANSADIEYRCTTRTIERHTTIKPAGMNAHIIAISIAMSGLLSTDT